MTSVKQNVDEDLCYYVQPYDLAWITSMLLLILWSMAACNAEASTVLDCTGDAIQVIRQVLVSWIFSSI